MSIPITECFGTLAIRSAKVETTIDSGRALPSWTKARQPPRQPSTPTRQGVDSLLFENDIRTSYEARRRSYLGASLPIRRGDCRVQLIYGLRYHPKRTHAPAVEKRLAVS